MIKMEQEQNARALIKVAGLLTDKLKEIWGNFMEEFQQSFDSNQLDLVFSVLKELRSSSQNPTKKKRTQLMWNGDNSNNDKSNSSSLEKKVFGNHLLAKSVFQCLSNADLLSCRLMNSYWNEYATEMLLKRDFNINFRRRTSTNRFYRGASYSDISNWRSLDMFTQLLRTSKQFPCNKFVFCGGNLGNDDAQRFFSFYGSEIKSIKISLDDENCEQDNGKSENGFAVGLTDSRTIGMILSQQLPSLENLELDLCLEYETDWPGFKSLLFPSDKQVQLSNLKTVIYNCDVDDDDFIRQLLNATINLKQFEFASLFLNEFIIYYLDLFIEIGKIKVIHGVSFKPKNYLNELEKMVGHGPELKSLMLEGLCSVYKNPELWGKIAIVLSKFLHSSQKSLQQLYSFKSLGFLRQLQFPVLENIKNLRLQVMKESEFNTQHIHDYSFAFLPPGATFSKNFPRLSSVEISSCFDISSADADSWWKKCFPSDEIVPTVKKLEISEYSHSCPLLWMEKLSKIFPNLESLSVRNIKDFPNFSKSIWTHHRQLKDLTVGIDLTSPLNSHPFILDSCFTGISLETCKTLEKRSLFNLERMGDNFRDNPSILNLKGLLTLDITFQVNYQEPQQIHSTNFLTQISGPCAFNLLENLKSANMWFRGVQDEKVLSKIKKSMEPLKAYKVNIK